MTNDKGMNEFPLLSPDDGIPLFYPYIPKSAIDSVVQTLGTRWIGQGPKVEQFEAELRAKFAKNCEVIAVGSGTDALHLAYLLADIKKDDEVIVPVFTCTATNIPLLYIGAKPIFADINPATMNIELEHVESLITPKTKAIVCVDYGGYPCDYSNLIKICKKFDLKLISDAAHSIGTKYNGKFACEYADFTIFSFQAIKTLTTGDGGALIIKDPNLLEKAKRLRWFGIDRTAKQMGIWENDINEIGYKYQMTDIAASLGIEALKISENIFDYRKKLFSRYKEKLLNIKNIKLIGGDESENIDFCPWLITILTDKRLELMKYLRENNVESGQVHYRNDRYSIFRTKRDSLPMMNKLEDKYLVLPLHMAMKEEQVDLICDIVSKFQNSR